MGKVSFKSMLSAGFAVLAFHAVPANSASNLNQIALMEGGGGSGTKICSYVECTTASDCGVSSSNTYSYVCENYQCKTETNPIGCDSASDCTDIPSTTTSANGLTTCTYSGVCKGGTCQYPSSCTTVECTNASHCTNVPSTTTSSGNGSTTTCTYSAVCSAGTCTYPKSCSSTRTAECYTASECTDVPSTTRTSGNGGITTCTYSAQCSNYSCSYPKSCTTVECYKASDCGSSAYGTYSCTNNTCKYKPYECVTKNDCFCAVNMDQDVTISCVSHKCKCTYVDKPVSSTPSSNTSSSSSSSSSSNTSSSSSGGGSSGRTSLIGGGGVNKNFSYTMM